MNQAIKLGISTAVLAFLGVSLAATPALASKDTVVSHGDKVSELATEEGKNVNIIKEKKDITDNNQGDKIKKVAASKGEAFDYNSKTVEGSDQATEVNARSAHKDRNPQTGKEIKIPAKKGALVVADDRGASDSAQKLAGEPDRPLPFQVETVADGKVKFFNEAKGYSFIIADSNGKDIKVNWYYEEEDEDMKTRKSRNPQTGKEIKIPAKHTKDGKVVDKSVGLVDEDDEDMLEASEDDIIKIREKESGEEYFVHATGLIDEIRDEDDVTIELRKGRKGMNAVDVRRTD